MIIWLLLLIGLILRLINLNQSLWLDEAVQAITAQKSFSYIFQEITGDFHPPLYHFLMHFWVRIFGSSEIALRMPSVIFGVLTVWIVYRLGKLLGGRKWGLIGAVFMATAPFHIYYSQEARMYSMTCFFAVLSMYYFVKFFLKYFSDQQPSAKFKVQSSRSQFKVQNFDYLWYFLATLCLVYSDYYGFLVLLAQGVYLLIKKKYKYLILNTVFLILFYLPWLPMFITQIKTGILATQNLPEWGKLVNVSFLKAIPLTLVKFSIGRITIFDKKLYTGVIVAICFLYGGLLTRTVKGYLKERSKDGKGVIVSWFFVPLIIVWLASLFVPNFQPFRLLLILPAFYLLLVGGVSEFKSSAVRKIFIVLILSINLVSLGVYYFNPYFHREDWRGAIEFLKNQSTVAVLPSETSSWPVKHYDPDNKIRLIYGGTGVNKVENLENLEQAESGVYYIRYLVPLFDPDEKILEELDKRGYTKVSEVSFNQIPLWEFKKR